MSDKIVKDVFDDVCAELKIDSALIKRIITYQVQFVNKNEEHIEFFGGHTLGVQRVRFTNSDNDKWFDEIIEADEVVLTERIHALPGINPDFNVSSDIFNLSCFWLAHSIYHSAKLTEVQKEEGMLNVMLILQYRFITSRIVNHFKYPADKHVAECTYNQLSYKFAIKQFGTWFNVLKQRATDIISKDGIHFKTIVDFNDDDKIVRMVNDTQGRIREMVKNIYTVFIETHNSGMKIVSSTDIVEFDGGAILKDKVKGLSNYKQYIRSVLTEQTNYVKEELVNVIESIMHTMPQKLFREALVWTSNEYAKNSTGVIDTFVDELLTHSFAFLADHTSLVRNTVDLVGMLNQIKGVYNSSRSTDPSLKAIRDQAEELVKKATNNKNANTIASIRTGLMLYTVARTYTKSHYS